MDHKDVMGDKRKNIKYRLPFPTKIKTRIIVPKSHKKYLESKYALDFPLPIGTPVFAARGGKVWLVKADSNKYGDDSRFALQANFVAIDHGDGTYAEYIHLGKNQVVVGKGQRVRAGKILGYVGLSGYITAPHLHFNVFQIRDKRGISIPVEFE